MDEKLSRSDIRTDPATNAVSAGVPLVLNMIHFKVRLIAGSQTAYEFTSQFFFDDTLSDAVYAQNAPYNTRRARDQRNSTDGIYQQLVNDGTGRKSGDLLLLQVAPAKRTEDGYVGTLDIGVTLT